MAKNNAKMDGYGRLLDAWKPPEGAGYPIGCVATSFTFSNVFFEEECICRFLQMQSDAAQDGPAYIIEREEKLSEVQCISVMVDSCHCKGNRSLRWDLLSARVPGAILHAKISLLKWSNCVRVIVGSANLTEDGYRRNQEVFGFVDYFEGGDAPVQFLDDILAYLRQAIDYAEGGSSDPSPATLRWNNFLDGVDEVSRAWGGLQDVRSRKSPRLYAVLTGPGYPSLLDQLSELWPEAAPPAYAVVTSPFFDPPGSPNKPAQELWSTLKQRGEAGVTYNITAEDVMGENAILLHGPQEILAAEPKGRQQVYTEINRIREQPNDEISAYRSLHLKSIQFEGADWIGHIIGSSNFTSNGLGLSAHPNLEANILYLVSEFSNPKGANRLRKGAPQAEEIDQGLELRWTPKAEDEEDAPDYVDLPLPKAFGQAIFKSDGSVGKVVLNIIEKPPAGWIIYRHIDSDDVFFDEKKWSELGNSKIVEIAWQDSIPPSGFEVTWNTSHGRAWWPVNVDRATSLPSPDELRDLPLEVLINILTSARPLHQALRRWLKRKNNGGNSEDLASIRDPHRRVDTSGFLLQKTYRITSALLALRERLERPVASEDAMHWRLWGPVGADAVARAIEKEARLNAEKAFLLNELAMEMARTKPKTAPGHLAEDAITKEIKSFTETLKEKISKELKGAPISLVKYIKSAMKEVRM